MKLLLRVSQRMPDVRFTIIGSAGPLKTEVQSWTNGTRKWLSSIPHRQIISIIKTHQVAVCPSLVDESFGKAALEYRLSGIKIVATKSGALPEVLADYPNVVWCEKTVESLEESLRQALNQNPTVESWAARQNLYLKFSPAMVAQKYQQLYEAVVSTVSRSPRRLSG